MSLTKLVNGVEVAMTSEEEAAFTLESDQAAADYAADQASNGYKYSRATAYPSIGDQLDMLYWDEVNGTTTFKDAIASVKAQYPKPA